MGHWLMLSCFQRKQGKRYLGAIQRTGGRESPHNKIRQILNVNKECADTRATGICPRNTNCTRDKMLHELVYGTWVAVGRAVEAGKEAEGLEEEAVEGLEA